MSVYNIILRLSPDIALVAKSKWVWVLRFFLFLIALFALGESTWRIGVVLGWIALESLFFDIFTTRGNPVSYFNDWYKNPIDSEKRVVYTFWINSAQILIAFIFTIFSLLKVISEM